MIKDLIDRVNHIIEEFRTLNLKVDALTTKVDAISEDVQDVCDEMFGDPDGETDQLADQTSRVSIQPLDEGEVDLNDLVRPRTRNN